MSLLSKIKGALLGSAGMVAAASVAWGQTEAEKALAGIKRSDTGAKILNLVKAAEATGEDGATKKASVMAAAAPLILDLVFDGGKWTVIKDVEALTSAVVESFVTDLKSGSLATAVLTALAH